MAKLHRPLALANYFIEKFEVGTGIEHMKLQKLIYCAHGWSLGVRQSTIVDERPQVWEYGPVFESLYRALKPFGRKPITKPISVGPFDEPASIEDDENTGMLLDWIWDRYGHLSGFALSDMTHKDGTPWERIAREKDFLVPYGTEIPDDYIKEEFEKIYRGDLRADARRSVTN